MVFKWLLFLTCGFLLSNCAFDPSGSYSGTLTQDGELFIMAKPPGSDGRGAHRVIPVALTQSDLRAVVRKVKEDELSIELQGRCSFLIRTAPEASVDRGEVILSPPQRCPLKVEGKSYSATVSGAISFQRDPTPVTLEASFVLSPGEYPASDKPGSVSGAISWKYTGRAVKSQPAR